MALDIAMELEGEFPGTEEDLCLSCLGHLVGYGMEDVMPGVGYLVNKPGC